jgi:hypothetical protein
MEHPVDAEEIMALLDGELNGAAESHLESCAECQRMAGDYRALSRALQTWQIEPATFNLDTSSIRPRPAWSAWFGTPRLWQLGFAGAVVCALGLVLVRPRVTTVAPASMARPQAHMEPSPILRKLQSSGQQAANLVAEQMPIPAQMIVRTAEMEIATSDLTKTRALLEASLQRLHGYIAALNTRTPEDSGRVLQATLRIPADRLDDLLVELRKLGRVLQESQNGSEITQQYVDLEARLSNARNTERRLTDLERREGGRLSDVLAIEKEIDRVRGQIEQMEAERKNLANQVALATVRVTMTETYEARVHVLPPSLSARFRNAAVSGYRSVVDSVIGIAEFLLSWGPGILLWATILFVPARLLWKRFPRS